MADDNIISLADKGETSDTWTPEDMLLDQLEKYRSGERAGKCAVIWLDDTDRKYATGAGYAGFHKMSEVAILLEIVKLQILKEDMQVI